VTLDASTATEEAFRREAPKKTYLHIYAHGSFGGATTRYLLNRPVYDDSHPEQRGLFTSQSLDGYHPNLLAGIALTGANQQKAWSMEDGRLIAEEIQTLDLRPIDLVVLSSCETALGERTAGEGLIGVQRAFHMAGASTVIAALWRVDAAANRELLARFYDNLWNKGFGKVQALREAQLWMLRERGYDGVLSRLAPAGLVTQERPQRLPPYLWAGFVLSGDWRGGGSGRAEK
jgi:hypothetical protein